MPFLQALRLQERVRDEVVAGQAPETLLLLEHEPVITLGRHARPSNVLASPAQLAKDGIAVVPTSRGGDVTFHGPGQLVGYPVFRLPAGIRAHVAAMATAIVSVLAELGIPGEWRASQPGIWVGSDKICAVGVHVRRGVALHGFALNADTDLTAFRAIVPCGLHAAGVTSIAKLRGSAPALGELAERVANACTRAFAMPMKKIPAHASRLQVANGES